MTDSTSTLVAVKLPLTAKGSHAEDVSNESVSKHLGNEVKGTSVEIGAGGEELGMSCDLEKIRKTYKLGGDRSGRSNKGKKGELANGDGADKEERKEMEGVILGIMALKGA